MKKFLLSILLTVVSFQLFGKTERNELHERIFVQTDKQLYLAGEFVLMKLFTTDTEQIPLVFSKVAYVELVDDSLAKQQIKVELINGAGEGIMQLPAYLQTGYYRLITYTQLMRNEGEEVFFEKNIGIVNTFQSGDYYVDMEQKEQFSLQDESNYGAVSLRSDKEIYATRDRGELILTGLPDNIHSLSVSIAGKELIPVADPDVSLLRKNSLKKSLEYTGEYLPEYEGHIITGKIIDNQTGNPVLDKVSITTGLSFSGDGIRFFPGQQNKTGDVRFITSGISGIKEIATVADDPDEKLRVDIQSPFVSRFASKPMPVLHIDSVHYSQLLARSVALQLLHYFSNDSLDNHTVSEPHFKMKPTWSYLLDEYTRFTTMREVFTEFIKEGGFRRRDGKWEISIIVKRSDNTVQYSMPLVFLDGVPILDHEIVFNYDPLTVEKINVYHVPSLMGGYKFDGIIELITYDKLHQDLNLNKSTQIVPYEGPQLHHQFHTPDYSDEKNRRSRIPDGRHTLLWNPDVQTDGKSFATLPFDTSDLTGEFQATVEGITKEGEIIFATFSFNVIK